jgi:hypothetical protein
MFPFKKTKLTQQLMLKKYRCLKNGDTTPLSTIQRHLLSMGNMLKRIHLVICNQFLIFQQV